MSLQEAGIEYKELESALVATLRCPIKDRSELRPIFAKLLQNIPPEHIAGPAFCIVRFVSNVKEGLDVEAGFPVTQPFQTEEIETRPMAKLQVLSLVHAGPVEKLGEGYRRLYGTAAAHGLVSDEFAREVYEDANDPTRHTIEIQFVIHNWNALLAQNVERVLGEAARQQVMQEVDRLTLESAVDERFQWVKGAMTKLEGLAGEAERFDIVSSCAHVFPKDMIEEFGAIYRAARLQTGDVLKAVDATIEFMNKDSAKLTFREGNIIYTTKGPRDPAGHEKAQDEREKKKAYCFCPLVRNHLEQGMPLTFCCCGAGWYRQQWEGALGRPLKIDIVKSLLKGDELCQFAIHLPADL